MSSRQWTFLANISMKAVVKASDSNIVLFRDALVYNCVHFLKLNRGGGGEDGLMLHPNINTTS